MKFTITMKDPDTLYDAVLDAVRADLGSIAGLSKAEQELLVEERSATVRKICQQWFEYGEYITVEIDTEAKTCTVVECE